jgi:hypothetical protein
LGAETNHSNKTSQLWDIDLWLLCEALPGHCHELVLTFRECESHFSIEPICLSGVVVVTLNVVVIDVLMQTTRLCGRGRRQ